MPPYTIPYAPTRGYDYGRNRIADLIMAAGRAQAEGAARSGQIWGNAVQGLAGIAGNAIQDHAQRSEEKKAAEAVSKRDGAFLRAFQDSGGNLAPEVALSIYGPEKGLKVAEGVASLRQLQDAAQRRDAEAAMKSAPALVRGLLAMGDGARDQAYAGIVPLWEQATGQRLPDAPTPDVWKQLGAWADEVAPVKTRGVTVRNPDGSTVERIVPDRPGQEFVSAPEQANPEPRVVGRALVGPTGEVIYRDPEPPKESRREWVVRDGKTLHVSPEEIMPGDTPYAPPRQSLKNVLSGDANRIADLDSSLDDLAKIAPDLNKTGTLSAIGAAVPNVVTEWTGWGEDAKSQQALLDRVKQVIGKALEEGVLRKEDERKYEKILPRIGDPPAVAASKMRDLAKAITLKRSRLLESLSDAGFDVTRYQERERIEPEPPPGKVERWGRDKNGRLVRLQ